jgi:hypothetical protein
MDALEELKRALDEYKGANHLDWLPDMKLCNAVLRHLPALIAELEARRAAMGGDVTTSAGFSGQATEALR